MPKSRVVCLDPCLGDDGDALAVDLAQQELIAERLLEHEADAALGVRHDQVQRRRMHFVAGQLVPAQNEANLRTIAVGEHDRPPCLHHVGHAAYRLAHRIPLVGHIRQFVVQN